ncbi:MAG: hypothetical protein ACI8T1_005161 [Verrucomicrobiales bacterium]|jgi:hypothetical protein
MDSPATTEPFIIQSSARSLWGRFTLPAVMLMLLVGLALYLRKVASIDFATLLLAGAGLIGLMTLIKAALAWIRIRNTEYAIYPQQIQESSYLFKFLGAKNNNVKLNEVKQIRCFSNGWLDVWFFNCGKIQIVTSGDNVDFITEDVYDPMKVKDRLELQIFGEVAANESGSEPVQAKPSVPFAGCRFTCYRKAPFITQTLGS